MEDENFRGRLMTLRIIWAALVTGIIIFVLVALVIGPNNPPQDPAFARLLLYIAVVMAATMLPVGFFVRRTIWNKGGGGAVDRAVTSPATSSSGRCATASRCSPPSAHCSTAARAASHCCWRDDPDHARHLSYRRTLARAGRNRADPPARVKDQVT